jgi:hypothetical protein
LRWGEETDLLVCRLLASARNDKRGNCQTDNEEQ